MHRDRFPTPIPMKGLCPLGTSPAEGWQGMGPYFLGSPSG